jgi:isopentenyl-diphosphate delta-isomerase
MITPPTGGEEYVVLTNEHGVPIGAAPKATVHTTTTPPHRAFSCFLFDHAGNLLIAQRSLSKKTWPGVWTNSCCGHPKLDETPVQAAARRITFELGMEAPHLVEILPGFRYYVEREGVVEREFCPVVVGFTNKEPHPNPNEVGAFRWIPWSLYVAIAENLREHLQGHAPKDAHEYARYRASFVSPEHYRLAHSLPTGEPLSEWSLWETLELLQSESFKDLLSKNPLHGTHTRA